MEVHSFVIFEFIKSFEIAQASSDRKILSRTHDCFYKFIFYEFKNIFITGLYGSESVSSPARGSVHHVILYKDAIYDDYGFSVSDGLYERGVYINRIRKGGPADIVGLLRPYDRILQVCFNKNLCYKTHTINTDFKTFVVIY